jgi:hypothetical protein
MNNEAQSAFSLLITNYSLLIRNLYYVIAHFTLHIQFSFLYREVDG